MKIGFDDQAPLVRLPANNGFAFDNMGYYRLHGLFNDVVTRRLDHHGWRLCRIRTCVNS
jgi:hypothetical protein